MQRNFEPMRKQVEAWQRSELTDVTAKVVIYEAFVEGRLEAPKHLARTVHDLYFEPKYEEFRPRTIEGQLPCTPVLLAAFSMSNDSPIVHCDNHEGLVQFEFSTMQVSFPVQPSQSENRVLLLPGFVTIADAAICLRSQDPPAL